MTAAGKQVKPQTLQTEQEIFLYDRRLLAATPTNLRNSHIRNPSFNKSALPAPPKPISPEATLRAWQKLFKERQKWAAHVAEASRKTIEQILELEQERHVVQRATAIAVTNIKQHLENLKPKYNDTKKWADQICEDQKFLLDHWLDRLDKLKRITALPNLVPLFRNNKTNELPERSSHVDIKLHNLINLQDVKKAGSESQELYQEFTERVDEAKRTHDRIIADSDRIAEEFENNLTSLSDSEIGNRADGLIEEVEVLAGKLTADSEAVQKLPDAPKSLAQVSKTSQLHESSFVNTLIQTNEEIRVLLQQIIDLKADIAKSSLQHLQQISVVESSIQSMHSLLAHLNIDSKSSRVFETLNFEVRLPATFGSLLVESVRRYEYFMKRSGNRSSLFGEKDNTKADERKRRQRWADEMDDTVDMQLFDEMTSGQQEKWPVVNRQDIENFVLQMEEVGGLDDVVKEVKDFYNSLNDPPKQQTRRESTFKNGSLHEADHGRSSLLPQKNDETMTSIRKAKMKTEERLKGAEARIRKLEGLLSRQSRPSRPSSAVYMESDSTPTFERQASSPVPNFTSALSKAREPDPRRTTTSSRRFSFNAEAEDQTLAKRVVSLEAELLAQKEQSKGWEKQSSGRTNAEEMLKEQAQDAIRTKEDLLGNLEAQKQEFEHDRLIFAEETKKLKIRIEELEDEIDRVDQSQEQEFKIQALTEDMDNMKRDTASEMRRARQETEEVRQAYLTSRDHNSQIDRELRRLAEEKSQFQSQADEQLTQLRVRDQALADHHRALRSALLHISNEKAPEDFASLVEIIENAAEKSAADQKALETALQGLKDDNGALNTRLGSSNDEIYDLRERVGDEERQKISFSEQLETARKEQQNLESQMATGSTEAEDLRERIHAEEQKNADIHSQIEELDGKVQHLLSQLDEKRSEMASLEGSYVRLNSNRDAQATRADEVSSRLLVQNLTIQHLLEQIGFSVTKQDNNTVIQRISSRTTGASTTLNDQSALMKRSISGPLPTKSDLESMIDPEILHWAKIEDSDQASKSYDEFINNAVNLDMDVFYETMYKRIKEIEHIARKGQRDARAYRDKAHQAQSNAHDRLALRNFKEGDLALFLPTRDQATKPWAAFNVGAPHYFLREQDSHKLSKRDWLIARISKVEKRVVDLSRSINGMKLDERNAES